MSDIMNRLVAIYGARDGEIRLTDRQERALQKACVFQTLGYHFSRFCFAEPTYSDAEVAKMCGGYGFIARITRGSSDDPYVVFNPSRPDPPQPCLSFADAMKCAHDMRCDLVLAPADIFQPEFDSIADHWRIVILIV